MNTLKVTLANFAITPNGPLFVTQTFERVTKYETINDRLLIEQDDGTITIYSWRQVMNVAVDLHGSILKVAPGAQVAPPK